MSDTTTLDPTLAEVTSHPYGAFSWVSLDAVDPEAAKRFYSALFGWSYVDMPAGGDEIYTMFFIDGKSVAGLGTQPQELREAGVPSSWGVFVNVEDAEAAVQKAQTAGARLLFPAMDIFDSGRMAGIQDPTGAAVALWQARNHIGSSYTAGAGVAVWFELYTHDVAAAAAFYTEWLGWTTGTTEFQGQPAAFCHNNGQPVSMILPLAGPMADTPPHWALYFGVTDVPQAVERVQELGGTVLAGPTVSSGYPYAIVQDPQGAAFYIVGPPTGA